MNKNQEHYLNILKHFGKDYRQEYKKEPHTTVDGKIQPTLSFVLYVIKKYDEKMWDMVTNTIEHIAKKVKKKK